MSQGLGLATSACLLGIDGHAVQVEVHVSDGLPAFAIVGSPDPACREASGRVRAALTTSRFAWPQARVTVNLAPPTIRKVGSGLDLAIAIALLVASGQLEPELVEGVAFVGELGLDGAIRPVRGTLSLAEALGAMPLVVAEASAAEAGLVGDREVRAAATLREVVACLRGEQPWTAVRPEPPSPWPLRIGGDLAEVRGQPVGRYALEVAAAGGHHLLLLGPPGAGKTMLAARLPSILPTLDDEEALQTTKVHSAVGVPLPPGGLVREPPFRAPHHGASSVALIGGGSAAVRPGEISNATNGVLFLDELAEFDAHVLDAMRQPLEEGVVRVARAAGSFAFPARFLLVAAMNPCPCGLGNRPGGCRCTDAARLRYQRRLSGPLLDRFDLRVEVAKPSTADLFGTGRGESSAAVRERVLAVRALAAERGVRTNAGIPSDRLDEVAPLHPDALASLKRALEEGRLSARGLHRVRRVARTIADLQGIDLEVDAASVATALNLRSDIGAEAAPAARAG